MATFLLLPSPSCASLLSNTESYRFGCSLTSIQSRKAKDFRVRAVREKTEEIKSPSKTSSPEDVTKKYGLEAGLWKIFSSKEEGGEHQKSKGDQAKELLAKYGGAYLATSITLSLISFALCYALVNAGVDVQSLLQKAEIENLTMEERRLDEQIREMQERLRDLSEDENNEKLLFVTEEDIKNLPCFQNETLIAIKAPHGTTLEVPDPDEAADYPQRRYRIVLRSTMGPIDVYLVSQFEEKFEEVNGVEVAPKIPSSPEVSQHPCTVVPEDKGKEIEVQRQDGEGPSSDLTNNHDFVSGIMKIVPSDVASDADYWLLSDADVSITDMWRTEPGVEWNELNALQEDYCMAREDNTTPNHPSNTGEDSSAANPTVG